VSESASDTERRSRRVSVLVPARDEQRHIDTCVSSILRQEVEGGLEVIVADGGSVDDTAGVAGSRGATVVASPEGSIPASLNRALARASGEIVVRFDAHAEMPPGYIRNCVQVLEEEPGPACVGGWRQVAPVGPWGRAVGAAMRSRLGVGNPRIWRPPHAASGRREVETLPLGCWRTRDLRDLGG
jgi:succinoglycan biosynthesis protein ExoA